MARRKPAAVDNPVEESGSSAVARAAEELADAAEMLAASGESGGGSKHSRKKHHRIRKLLVLSGLVSLAYVLVAKTPLKAKLSELVFGPPLDDDEPESITLPVKEPVAKAANTKSEVEAKEGGAGKSTGADDG